MHNIDESCRYWYPITSFVRWMSQCQSCELYLLSSSSIINSWSYVWGFPKKGISPFLWNIYTYVYEENPKIASSLLAGPNIFLLLEISHHIFDKLDSYPNKTWKFNVFPEFITWNMIWKVKLSKATQSSQLNCSTECRLGVGKKPPGRLGSVFSKCGEGKHQFLGQRMKHVPPPKDRWQSRAERQIMGAVPSKYPEQYHTLHLRVHFLGKGKMAAFER